MDDGLVTIAGDTAYSQELGRSIAAWNSALGGKIQMARTNSASPSLIVVDLPTSTFDSPARYVAPAKPGDAARIEINRPAVANLTSDQVLSVISHELSHAVGLSDTSGSPSEITFPGAQRTALIPGPADQKLIDSLGPNGVPCGDGNPAIQYVNYPSAPITPENPNGCQMYAEGMHVRDSTGGAGFKAVLVCQVPTKVTFNMRMDKKACGLLPHGCWNTVVLATDISITSKKPDRYVKYQDLTTPCKNKKDTVWQGYVEKAHYQIGDNVYTLPGRMSAGPSAPLPCGT